MTILYGISNCDSVKKARRWLDTQQINYRFSDFRKDGLDSDQVSLWLRELGWEALINRRSTTWKALDEQDRQALSTAAAADLITQHPTLIKRPLLQHNGQLTAGFKQADYEKIFG